MAEEVGTYVLPVIASFEGIDKQVNSKLSKAFGATGKKAGADLAKGAGEGLKALEKEVESAQKAYDRLADKAADALDKITVEEKKLAKARSGGKEDQIAAAEARLAKARRDSARAIKDSDSGHRALLDSQKRLGAGSDDLGGKFGRLSGVAAGAGAAMSAVAAPVTIAVTAFAALAAGVFVAGNRLYELGAQFDDLADNLQVKTGLSGKALDDLTDSVTRLGTTNVPSTFAEIGDVAAEVTRNLHLTGQPLEDITSRLANLARMGQDVDVRALGKVFRGFGVEAQDQVGALNSLYEASTQTGLSIDDLTASLTKGGAPLRQLGLGFGESAALMTSLEAAGLDGEKGVLALNKAFAYFSKEGIPAEQGLQDIITRIQELGDVPQAGELANKVFGARGGAQFLEAIQSGAVDLQSLSASLATTGLDINQVAADTADWTERWQDLKNETAVALEPLANRVFDGVNEQLTELADWVSENQDEVIGFFTGIAEASVMAAEVVIKSIGLLAEGTGQLIAPIGDVLGGILKTGAALQRLTGDTETADQWDREADALFGLGEGLTEFGRNAKDINLDGLRSSIRDIGEESKGADEKSSWFGDSLKDTGDKADTTRKQLEDLRTEVGKLPMPGSPLVPNGLVPSTGTQPGSIPGAAAPPFILPSTPNISGGGSGAGLNLQIAAGRMPGMPTGVGTTIGAGSGGVPRKVGSDKGLLPQTVGVKDQIAGSFGNITDIGGWRPPDGYNEHSSGRAIDVMIPNWNTAAGKAQGDQVAQMALQNPNVSYVLWQQKQWNADGTSSAMSDRGSPTQNHMDHVHVYTNADSQGTHPTGTPPTVNTSGATTSLSSSTQSLNFPAAAMGMPTGASVPGFNEYGEPGMYEQDPKAMRQAQQSIADAEERVKRADQQAAEAEARLAELDVDASESQKISAQNAVENAKADAEKARREANDAKTDAAETAKGTFKAAREPKSGGAGGGQGGGMGGLGELGSIAGSFFKETFGFDGSFLPDLSSLGAVQSVGSLLNAFSGPLQGLVDGKLGIQQPGWSPGMPVPGMETSGGAFGMPNVAVPPMPAPGAHPGTGAPPGPAPQQITIDQSVHGNVGSSPAELFKTRDQGLGRAMARMPPR